MRWPKPTHDQVVRGIAAAFLFALAALAIFWAVLRYTWYGLALRAASQSRVGVQTAGIDVLSVDRIAFGIGVAIWHRVGLGAVLGAIALVLCGLVGWLTGLMDAAAYEADAASRAH